LQSQIYTSGDTEEDEMSTALETTIDAPLKRGFDTVADEDTVQRTAAALEQNGMTVLRASDAAEARRIVVGLVPPGSQVHHGASKTLEAIGIAALLDESGRYEALGPRVRSMDRATQGDEIRRLSSTPDFMFGSVHAVTETGSLMAASMSGSQLAPYVAGAGRVIFVVGTQKIVPDLDAGLRRIYDYSFPLEDARAQAAYGIHSGVNKIVIINREISPGRITVVLVDEPLGF
jgi:L-lactate utilization protein LutC